jgi:putative NADH-flavin reductase
MKVVIFGATGFAGRAILKEALTQNHEVTILVRDTESMIPEGNFRVVKGNALDPQTVDALMQGQDAVINALGIGGRGNGKPTTFISDATKILVGAMEKNNVKKLVALSNVGAGDSINFWPRWISTILFATYLRWLKPIIDDKNRMEPMIMNSNLQDWTIVRCTDMVDKPAKGHVQASFDGKGLGLFITLGDMAKFMVDQLTDSTYSKKTPSISN